MWQVAPESTIQAHFSFGLSADNAWLTINPELSLSELLVCVDTGATL